MSNALEVADATFQKEVLQSQTPVLVDFWATWCGPCRVMSPVVDKLADELKGKLKVVKVNTEDNPATPSSYGVNAIPTFIVFKGGKEVARHIGGMPYEKLKGMVAGHL